LNIATLQCRNEGEEYCAFSAPLLRQNAPDPAAACAVVQNERRRGILGPGVGSVGMGRAVQMGDVPKTGQVRRHCSWLQASLPQNSPACWRPLFPATGFGQHDCLDVGVFKNTSLAAVLIGSISPASERCSGGHLQSDVESGLLSILPSATVLGDRAGKGAAGSAASRKPLRVSAGWLKLLKFPPFE
jgi:hypothetical protein